MSIRKLCVTFDHYLSKLPSLMEYKGPGIYKTSDDAIVVIKHNKISAELHLVRGELIRKYCPAGKPDVLKRLVPNCSSVKAVITTMQLYLNT